MEKRSNALSIVLGLICAGLVAYIAFDKPVSASQTGTKDSASSLQQTASPSGAHSMMAKASLSAPDGQKNFCGIAPAMLIDLIRNYKRDVWSKTSMPGKGLMDARFMEISVEQLESFLAYAKSSAQSDGVNLTSVRFYYINYGGVKKNESELMASHTGNVFQDFAGCHSLALVPVVGNNMQDPNRKDYYRKGQNFAQLPTYNDLLGMNSENVANDQDNGMALIPSYDCNTASTVENHNAICPPMSGCATATLLSVADQE